jgi:hypothetical protein
MDYAKLLMQSAGKFDYRESPLDTAIKVNKLKKAVQIGDFGSIKKKEPYANKIQQFLTKEELNKRINDGSRQYLTGVYDYYKDKQLQALGNNREEQETFIKEARKHTQLMKVLKDPSQIEYLKKVDPVGLFYLEQQQQQTANKIQEAMADPTGENLRNLMRALPLNMPDSSDANSTVDSFSLPSRSEIADGNVPTLYGLTENARDAMDRYAKSISQSSEISSEPSNPYLSQPVRKLLSQDIVSNQPQDQPVAQTGFPSSQFIRPMVQDIVSNQPLAEPVAPPGMSNTDMQRWIKQNYPEESVGQLNKTKLASIIERRTGRKYDTTKSSPVKVESVKPKGKGKGFLPLPAYPNQNEYNREQAHKLLLQAKGGSAADLIHKIIDGFHFIDNLT